MKPLNIGRRRAHCHSCEKRKKQVKFEARMDQQTFNIFIFILTFIPFALSQGDAPYGLCGTLPGDSFTFIEDAEKPFCFKFKNAKTSQPDSTYLYYYFGTRVDTYTLVSLQGCM